VVAPPYALRNATPDNILAHYLESIEASTLPVGIYDFGDRPEVANVIVPDKVLKKILAHEKVTLVKDSSGDAGRRKVILATRKKRKDLRILNGLEWDCVTYIKAGYDGLLLGGGVFNGYLARLIIDAVRAGDQKEAKALQKRMNEIMWAVYGGKDIECWLAGEKKLLCEMGIFRTTRNYLRYEVTKSCEKAIRKVLEDEQEVLLPRPEEEEADEEEG
jgi:dihydrodipicolinate synthase/N-acetylneuraminate lyase